MHINHVTLSTGHIAKTERSDVLPEITQLLAEWLSETTNTGALHALPVPSLSHFGAQVLVQNGALLVTVSAPTGPHQQGKPHKGQTIPLITMGVAQDAQQANELWLSMKKAFGAAQGLEMPETPWLVVAVHPGIAIYRGPVEWLGDFERCIAWAWITRRPNLQSV